MESLSPDKLVAIAKDCLGFPSNASSSSVPKALLDELSLHYQVYPYDLNFRLTLEPGHGYGTVACRETGCEGVVIALVKRGKVRDGGLTVGFGSLWPYRFHIAEHPTHIKNRHLRVKAEHLAKKHATSGVTNTPSAPRPLLVKKETSSLLATLDSPASSSPATRTPMSSPLLTPSHSQPARKLSSLVRVKPEPSEVALTPTTAKLYPALSSASLTLPHPARGPSSLVRVKPETSDVKTGASLYPALPSSLATETPSRLVSHPSPLKSDPKHTLPYKRSSDAVEFASSSDDPKGLLKRLKLDFSSPKVPLAAVDRNTGSSENLFALTPAEPAAPSIEDIRAKIESVQLLISHQQSAYSRLLRKSSLKLTKSDRTKMIKCEAELQRLRKLKEEYNAAIPSVSSVKRPLSTTASLSWVGPGIAQVTKHEPDVKVDMSGWVKPVPVLQNATQAFPKVPGVNQSQSQPHPQPHPQLVASSSKLTPPPPVQDPHHEDVHGQGIYGLPDVVMQLVGPIVPIIAPLGNAEDFDDNGDYYGRGRDMFVGPQAKADDIDKFLVEAGNAEAFDGNATVDEALEKLGLQTQYDLMPGMEVALMPHQTIGVAWMVEKEKSHLKGGALGDDMGLGKTVQMIATIVKNRSENPMCKTNLIITPAALLDQWKMEIEMKTNCDLNVLVYHGSSKPRRKQELLKYDVVLTTYSTMALEWPDLENEQKKKLKAKKKKKQGFIVSDDDDVSDDRRSRKGRGLLFQVEFYRIVLDEAQSIRNRRTRMSRAVTDLGASYRWCLTGTPIINSLVDVYGYLRFLKVRPWYDFQEFQSHIGILEKKNPTLAVSRLQAVIATFILRRMKDSMLDGKRLIELPGKAITLVRLEFSPEERDVYNMVERGAQANFNRYLRAGTVLKNYSQVLVLLLRLRQICSHPSLIQEGSAAFISPDEVDDGSKPELTTELTRARRLVSPEFVTKMKERFKDAALQRMKAEKESADAVADDEECPICFDALTDAVITPCAHEFCRECLADVINTPLTVAPDEPARYGANERPCPACRSPICSEKLFSRDAFLPSDEDLFPWGSKKVKSEDVEMADGTIRLKGGKGKGRKKARATKRRRIVDADDELVSEEESEDDDDDDDISDFIVEDGEDEEEKDARRLLKKRLGKRKANVVLDSDEEMEESPEETEVLFGRKVHVSADKIKLLPKFLPSTKMKFMMEQLRKLVEDRPDEKTMVVSQWTGCLSLVSDYLTEAGVIHVKYQGDMTRSKRDQAVRVFMSKDKARVMLMSLKCGGVGLNLTRANNVISLDLGWSQAIEAQSFDRVHRLGQTRPVVVQRLVISDTVEDRVLAMQERKKLLADGSLGEGSAKKIGRLSIRELANLFGLDHNGHRLEN